jgi:hypothetical protein
LQHGYQVLENEDRGMEGLFLRSDTGPEIGEHARKNRDTSLGIFIVFTDVEIENCAFIFSNFFLL